MEVPDSVQGSCMADCSVGSIVWVRRRNGSWWPGRILGPNELSASHLMSPRSGTPVKLLGREDASVDWYNLEKSKRVKAFRCGEFDDCIQRAEASQVVSIKKREKYARREDAILHALELEKLQLEKMEQKLGVASNCTGGKMPAVVKQELHTHLENLGSDHCKSQSLEDESMDNPLFSHKDEKSELMPRMRGLQDFGLRIAPKRKLSSFEGSWKLCAVDSHLLPGNNMGDENHSINSSSLAVNRERSEGGIAGESLVKRRDRRRPLVQVLQSSAKLLPGSQSLHLDSGSVSIPTTGEKEHREFIFRAKRSTCVYLPSNSNIDYTECPQDQSLVSPSQSGKGNNSPQTGSLAEENIFSELLEDTESDSSERNSVDPGKMEDERTQLSDTTEMQTLVEPRSMARCRIQGRIRDVSGEELKESMVTGFPHNQAAPISADVGVSKWKLKGKRNIRNLTKRPVEVMDGMISYGSIHGVYLEGKGNSLNQRAFKQGSYYRREELCYSYDEDDFIDRNSPWTKFSEIGNRRYLVPSKATYTNYSDATDSEEDYAWEANGPSQSGLRGYREDSDECLDPLCFDDYHGKGIDSKLLDVDLKVQASYQGEHVPLVSLMSRFNGKAIIGHPIQIEALENGSSTFLLSRNDDISNDPVNNDESTTPTPVWSTGRRTAMHRVPRPHPSSALEGDETIEPLQFSDPENKSSNKEEYSAGHLGHKARLVKNSSHIRRPPMGKKFHKKLLKKANISCQKTRTLSSFAVEEKFSGNSLDPKFVTKCNTNGLIKAVDSGPTAVTCIPVKLVFSRLLEAVGRPPYRAVP